MLGSLLLIIAGIAVVLWGADRFTDGASAVATRLRVPQIVIGLTVVAFGTSMPECFVSLVSAINGSPGMAIGNIVGSNIFNTLLIVGVAAIIAPIHISRQTARTDMLWAMLASLMLLCFCIDGCLQRMDGVVLLAAFAGFLIYTLRQARQGQEAAGSEPVKPMSSLRAGLYIVLGLVALIVGSNVFVQAATNLALALGVRPAVVGLTIVAGGTSLPELATSVVAARKGQAGIAIGNVIGSNVFNILWILGLTAVVCPLPMNGITGLDLAMLVVSMLLMWLFARTDLTVKRWEGAVLALLYVAYLAVLVLTATGAMTLPAFLLMG